MSSHRAARGLACMLFVGATLFSAVLRAPCAAAAEPDPARLPLEAFATLPALSGVMLSPDGRHIAALLNTSDRTVLVIRPLQGKKLQPVLSTDNQTFQFNWARWVNAERLLVSVRFAARRNFVGTTETRLLSVRADGSGQLNLVKNEALRGSALNRGHAHQLQDGVIDWLPEDGQHVLLQLASGADSVLPAVYRVNVETGERRLVQRAERQVRHWITDAQHRVRLGIHEVDGTYEVRAREPEGGDWRVLWAFDAGSADAVWPLGFGLDPQELFVLALHDGRRALYAVRLDQPGLPRTLRLALARHDVNGRLLRAPTTGAVIGLQGGGGPDDGDADSHSALWDASWQPLMQTLQQALPGRENRLIGISRDERQYLIYSTGNGQPGEYFAGDRRSGELALIGEDYPALSAAALAGKQHARIKARDRLELNAYLSLPPGHRADKDGALPLVLLPHSGPHARDRMDFDVWCEFLASRRYAVLQVNFRGSEGYGKAFRDAGLQRWGMEMQDDLSDAVAWAVAQGVADPRRVCIVGASYGGYAALMGAVKTPALYRCAVSFAGVSDLQDLISHYAQYVGGGAAAERLIGRYWGDRERLRATSPALQAERIQVPVLLVHGSADRSVPVEQSRDMAKALKQVGKRYEYIELDGGDHFLSRNSHRLRFFEALERFLAESLSPAANAASSVR